MLIDRFHHPFFHNTARMRFVDIDKLPDLLILESGT